MDEFAHAAFGQLFAGAFFNPLLRIASLAKGVGLKFVDELLGQFPVHDRRSRDCPVAFKQLFEAFLHQFVPVVENALSEHPSDLHDSGDVVLVLDDEAHHE